MGGGKSERKKGKIRKETYASDDQSTRCSSPDFVLNVSTGIVGRRRPPGSFAFAPGLGRASALPDRALKTKTLNAHDSKFAREVFIVGHLGPGESGGVFFLPGSSRKEDEMRSLYLQLFLE